MDGTDPTELTGRDRMDGKKVIYILIKRSKVC